jgi:hypothetical protein
MVIDGAVGGIHKKIGRPFFSPDGRHVAYWAERREAKGLHLMIDEQPVDRSDSSSDESLIRLDAMMERDGLPFAPDRERLAYFRERSGGISAVVHGVAGPAHEVIGRLVFSRDHSRWAYVAGDNSAAWRAIIGAKLAVVIATALLAAPFVDLTPGLHHRIVVNGVPWVQYPAPGDGYVDRMINVLVTPPRFSPDGTRLAYCSDHALVVDGAAGMRHACRSVSFSPDGRRVFQYGVHGGKWRVLVDGRQYGPHSGFGYSGPYGSGWRQSSAPYFDWGFTFTPDSRHLAYIAGDEGRFRVVLVPGGETLPYDHLPGAAVTSVPGHLVFIAIRGDDVFRVDVPLERLNPPGAALFARRTMAGAR